MTNLTPEMERVMVSLRARLNKKSDVDDSPLWNGGRSLECYAHQRGGRLSWRT